MSKIGACLTDLALLLQVSAALAPGAIASELSSIGSGSLLNSMSHLEDPILHSTPLSLHADGPFPRVSADCEDLDPGLREMAQSSHDMVGCRELRRWGTPSKEYWDGVGETKEAVLSCWCLSGLNLRSADILMFVLRSWWEP